MTSTAFRLPLDVTRRLDTRALDVLTARAIRLALEPLPAGDVPAELCEVAHGSIRIVDAAIARLEHALAEEESRTVRQAVADLRAARGRLAAERRQPPRPEAASPRTAS